MTSLILCGLFHLSGLSNASEFLPDENSELATLVWREQNGEETEANEKERKLEPHEQYPLGAGIRKNSKITLVPYCIAQDTQTRYCTVIQYFEVTGRVAEADADHVVDISHGAPEVSNHEISRTQDREPIGKPLVGYLFSGDGFEVFKDQYIQERLSRLANGKSEATWTAYYADEARYLWILGTVNTVIGGLYIDVVSWSRTQLFVKQIFLGVEAAFVVVPLAVTTTRDFLLPPLKRHFDKKMLLKKSKRISRAFIATKLTPENWALFKGVRVSAKTYDAFVDLLTQVPVSQK